MSQNSPLNLDLEGKRVVITGAGGGVGQHLVSSFHNAGSKVIACDRDAALLNALPQESLHEHHVFELSDSEAVKAAAKDIGSADILVNNAGFTKAENVSQMDDLAVRSEIDGNLVGSMNLTRALLPSMVSQGNGIIVNVASVNASLHFGNPIYSAAKAGLLAFTRAVAVEYGAKGIRANAVCPGSMLTNAWQARIDSNPGLVEELVKYYPSGRLVMPQELANTVLFLASPLSSGISGVDIAVDGGLTAGNMRLVRDIIGLE
ncbi:enoyl-(Acyl carrier protein) reductase domain-containing protein [Pochonia chlamydosporia 170]|uniref:Enoyl-(Acyl carrier protein) reductase domain-containing protein n=1 Tax=Pochonia chlamydosporia 170 TaxID=1380566 RepID=A0A179FI39_METCM|nr:enoyl-(Acyl carrier protein) reductase domain-containing protein [Pochonia chlamydosporia 170]OAQ65202.1 enoyl-(Acyl carrier protein) reductase domain-containing protein [Pochonia chlamydosporia 170]